MSIKVYPTSTPFQGPCAVAIAPGFVGPHCGIAYRVDDEPVRFLHLRWHLQLTDDAPPADGYWVQPALGRAQKLAIVGVTRLFANRYRDGAVPYGLAFDQVILAADGSVVLGTNYGLTCASLVCVLCEHAGVPLVVVDDWSRRPPARKKEDDAAQRRLVSHLRKDHPVQASRIEAEVGCNRIRPEEVAAASGLPHRPADYAAAEPAGRDVLAQAPALRRG